MTPKFSIVINTYNRADTLRICLDSLKYLRYLDFEVIVVNGPSTDETDCVLKTYEGTIKTGKCEEPNLAKSRNIGIALAAGDVVCFLDDDAVPEPNWLDMLSPCYAEPTVGAVGGYIRDHTGVAFQSKIVICDAFGDARHFATPFWARFYLRLNSSCYYSLTGTNCSFRREVLLKVSGFDEEYSYYLEETDLIVRIRNAGYGIKYAPQAEIHHKFAASHLRTPTRIPRSLLPEARSKAYFCVKNGSRHHRLRRIFRYLQGYKRLTMRNLSRLHRSGKMDAATLNRLTFEVEKGIESGISDALRFSRRRLWDNPMEQCHEPFLKFNPIRKSGDRLRICFLSQEYPPGYCGGIGVWTHQIATALARDGHEVYVITRGEGHATVDFMDGVWVHRVIEQSHLGRSQPPLPDLPRAIRNYCYTVFDEAKRIHQLRGIDIMSSPIWDLEGAACVAGGLFPTLVSLHSTYKMVLPTKPEWLANRSFLKRHVEKVITAEKWLLKEATGVIANSGAIVRDIEQYYGACIDEAKLALIPHGLDDRGTNPIPMSAHNEVLILFVGRFEHRKGIDVLLRTLPDTLRKFPMARVRLVGDADIPQGIGKTYKSEFLSKYRDSDWLDRIEFCGVVTDQELLMHYCECDIFVAPSRYESFGLVYLEAMMHGKPCIGTTAGGIPEVVLNETTGLLVEPDNEEQLLDALERLVADADLRGRLGSAGRDRFLKHFTTNRMSAAVASFFSTVSDPAPRRHIS